MGKQEQAIKLMMEEDYEAAAKLFVELIDENPADPVAYINFGNLLLTVKEYEKAEKFYFKAIQVDENTATAYYSLGNLYYDQAIYDQAATLFQEAIQRGLEDADVYYLCGMSLVKNKHHIQALPFLQRASELTEDVDKKFQHGLLLAELTYLDEAEKLFQQILEIDTEHCDTLFNLGVIAVYREQNKAAIELFNKVIALQPEHQLAINAKASLLEKVAEK